jgi:hypothetical protein
MAQTIIAPRGAVDVEPSILGNRSSMRDGSSIGVEVISGLEVCEQAPTNRTTRRQLIVTMDAERVFI